MRKLRFWNIAIASSAILTILISGQNKPKDAPGQGKEKPSAQRPDPDARLEQFRKLSGAWQGKSSESSMANPRVEYKVTGAGSAVVETLFPGTPHEMITVIHYDKDDLLLTHYCALGNQPRMKAEQPAASGGEAAKSAPLKQIKFTFMDGTNLASPNDPHMHAVTYTFTDNDHVRAEWIYYQDGKPAPEPTVLEFERVKGEKK